MVTLNNFVFNKFMSKKEKLGTISTFTGGVFWGISGTLGAYLISRKNLTANWIIPYRLILAGIIMLVYLYFRDKEKLFLIWKSKVDAVKIILFGTFGMLGTQYTYFKTIQYSNAGVATVLQYFGPTLILVYTCFNEKRIPKKYELSALILSISGIFILATHGNTRHLQISFEALSWGLTSAITLVFYTVQPIKLIKKYATMPVIAWGMFIGGIILSLFTKPWNESGIFDFSTFLAFAMIIFLGTIVSFAIYLYGVSIIGATKGSMIACIEPVAATFFSAVFLGTNFSFLDLIGFVFVLSTVFIVAYFGADEKNNKKRELK